MPAARSSAVALAVVMTTPARANALIGRATMAITRTLRHRARRACRQAMRAAAR
jgi:hypothetical protein